MLGHVRPPPQADPPRGKSGPEILSSSEGWHGTRLAQQAGASGDDEGAGEKGNRAHPQCGSDQGHAQRAREGPKDACSHACVEG